MILTGTLLHFSFVRDLGLRYVLCLNGHVAGTSADTATRAPLQRNGILWTNIWSLCYAIGLKHWICFQCTCTVLKLFCVLYCISCVLWGYICTTRTLGSHLSMMDQTLIMLFKWHHNSIVWFILPQQNMYTFTIVPCALKKKLLTDLQ